MSALCSDESICSLSSECQLAASIWMYVWKRADARDWILSGLDWTCNIFANASKRRRRCPFVRIARVAMHRGDADAAMPCVRAGGRGQLVHRKSCNCHLQQPQSTFTHKAMLNWGVCIFLVTLNRLVSYTKWWIQFKPEYVYYRDGCNTRV